MKDFITEILEEKYSGKEYDTSLLVGQLMGNFNEIEVCGIDVLMLAKTCKEVNEDYKHFKEYIKEITHKQPTQVLVYKFDKI